MLLIVLGLGEYVAPIPHAVLAAILIKIGIDIIDWRNLRYLINDSARIYVGHGCHNGDHGVSLIS